MSDYTLAAPAPAPPLPAEAVAAIEPNHYRFDFTGSGAEYFRVWIVNVALSIATLGIYSAWAKVRNRQYFYGNSHLAGASFEYTANPANILKGRLLVFSVFVAYQLAATFQPIVAGVLILVLIPLFPWMVVTALRFNHRYSAYRNLRFHFDGTYGESAKVYILWTIVIVLSFGLAYPFVAWRRKKFLVERSRYGNGRFGYQAEIGYFYVVYILAGVFYTAAVVGLGVFIGGAVALLGPQAAAKLQEGAGNGEPSGIAFIVLMAFVYVGFLLAFIVLNTGVQAAIANYVWSNASLERIRFKLNVNIITIIVIQVTNLLAIVASLGLLIPWAKVRITRYRLSCFSMIAPPEDLDRFMAAQRDAVSATGDEFGEALDLDLGL